VNALEKAYFNSYLSKEDYAVIRDEAYRKGSTIREHISNILSSYANKRKEEEGFAVKVRYRK
jgi:hypothetical protein